MPITHQDRQKPANILLCWNKMSLFDVYSGAASACPFIRSTDDSQFVLWEDWPLMVWYVQLNIKMKAIDWRSVICFDMFFVNSLSATEQDALHQPYLVIRSLGGLFASKMSDVSSPPSTIASISFFVFLPEWGMARRCTAMMSQLVVIASLKTVQRSKVQGCRKSTSPGRQQAVA